jgi:hypothetical protein
MASLVLRGFGGMAPSSVDVASDPSVAQAAQNLDLRYGDFRPLPQAANVATVTAGQTLYRFETAGGFITRPGVVNFVRGPIPTDSTERTYYTGDGAPKVTDIGGVVRQLGVPAPTTAPSVTTNVTDEYSTDDAAADQAKKLAEVVAAVRTGISWEYIGLTDADLAAKFVPGPAPWSYAFKIAGAMDDGAFVPTNAMHRNLMNDRVGFYLGAIGGVTYGFATMHVRGMQLVLGDISAALAAITNPSDATKPLLTAAQIDTFEAGLADTLKPAQGARDSAIDRLRVLKDQLVSLADTGSAAEAANAGAVRAFYDKAEVVAAIDDGVAQAVAAIRSALFTYNNP